MAGIYIRGLEIPKVPTRFIIFSDGRVENEDDPAYRYAAIQVPNHGDLIERRQLFDAVYKAYGIEADDSDCNVLMGIVNDATAVIPADREGEA